MRTRRAILKRCWSRAAYGLVPGRRPSRVVVALGVLAALLAVPVAARAAGSQADREADAGAAEAEAAAEPETRRFFFDAYGTLGLAYSSEDRADFAWLVTLPDGPGHSETVSPDLDSILAGQMTFHATRKLTAVVQVVAQQSADDDYDPHLEWANVHYQATPELGFRVGRMALPAFLVSQYRKVSFANPWVRPPVELYGLAPLFVVDGVEASYRHHGGVWTTTVSTVFGEAQIGTSGEESGVGEVRDVLNVNATVERGSLTARLAVARGELDVDAFDPLFDGFRAFGAGGEAIARRFEVDDRRFSFASAGLAHDPGPWFTMAELGWFDSSSVLGESVAGYVTAGVRWGPVAPYATYARVELLSESKHPGLPLAGLPPELVPRAVGLNAGLNTVLRSAVQQQSFALGGRWDFATGQALKLQVDFIDALDESPGSFINPQPGFEPGGSSQLVSLALVFVF